MRIVLVRVMRTTVFNPETAPPLGIIYISAYAREKRKGKDEFKLFDTSVCGFDEMEDAVREADIIGVSGLNRNAKEIGEFFNWARKLNKNAVYILGGPIATSTLTWAFRYFPVDFTVTYEGEETFVELLDALETRDREFSKIEGICFRENGSAKFTGRRPPIEDLDSLPLPAWDLLEHLFERYWSRKSLSIFRVGKRYMPLFTSRGCPYRCIYCHDIFTKSFRAHSPERVLTEIKHLYTKYGVTDFEFYDDIFNFDGERMKKICQLIVKEGLKIRMYFPNGLRCDRLKEDEIDWLAKAGTRLICFAFETASERLQRLIRRNLRFDKIHKALEYTVSKGIYTHGFFMLGLPTETEQEMKATVDFAVKSPLHSAGFFITVPQKGTELFQKYIGEDAPPILGADYFEYEGNGIANVPPEKIIRMRTIAYLRMYLNLKRIIRIIRTVPLRVIFTRRFMSLPLKLFAISLSGILKKLKI